jgi:hypothetical protein
MTPALWFVVAVSLAVGSALLGFWVLALAAGRVPETATGKREIWFHIAAEAVTACLLIAGAAATLADPRGGTPAALSCLGLGMLLYSITVSPGYYVDRGERPMVAMFAAVWAVAVPAMVLRVIA